MLYLNRFEYEPRKRANYITACDVVWLLGKRRDWRHENLSPKEAEEIWKLAKKDMS